MPIPKEISNMLDLGRKAIARISCVFCIENTKIAKNKCSHCAMALDYSYRWLLMAPSPRIIALWVHPLTQTHYICSGCCPLRGEPTESIDGNYHRNKTIQCWSNGITSLYRRYMVFPLRNTFTIENMVNGKKHHQNPSKISVPTEHFDQF